MSSPLERPAELSSPLPIQILLAIFGCFLVLLEGRLPNGRSFLPLRPCWF